MLKNLYVSYSKWLLDPSNSDLIFGYRSNPSSIIFDPSQIKLRLNVIFHYIIWYLTNNGNVLFLIDPKDSYFFSKFMFLCKTFKNCEVANTENLIKEKLLRNYFFRESKEKIVVALFLDSTLLNFLQEESLKLNFPLISFSYFNSNVNSSTLPVIHSDSFDSKNIIYNLLTLVLLKSIKKNEL